MKKIKVQRRKQTGWSVFPILSGLVVIGVSLWEHNTILIKVFVAGAAVFGWWILTLETYGEINE